MHYDEYFCYCKIFCLILTLNFHIINSKNLKTMKKTILSLAIVAALMTSCKEKTQEEAGEAVDAAATEVTEAVDSAAAGVDSAAAVAGDAVEAAADKAVDATKDAAAAGAAKVEAGAKAVKEEAKK